MSAYANLPLSALEKHLDTVMEKYSNLDLEDGDNSTALSKLSLQMEELGNAIKEAKKNQKPETKAEVATLGTAEAKFNYNSMVSHIKSNVPTLAPPLDVSVFIQRLDNCYNLFVKHHKYLEPYFIQQAKSQLSSDILENLNASSDNTDDFDKLKTYLKKNYGSKETPFQIMGELLESMPKEGERLQEWTARQERRSDIVATQIISKFNDHQKQLGKPDMTVKDSFNLFCSMVTYEYIRKNKPDCFKLMVKEVDTCWRPTEIGSLAATLLDRFENVDPHPAAHPSYSARQNTNKKQQNNKSGNKSSKAPFKSKDELKKEVCKPHLIGQCRFKDKCYRKHVNPGDKLFDEAIKSLYKGKNTNSQKTTPNTLVATTNSTTEELQPEFVGMDFFDSKN